MMGHQKVVQDQLFYSFHLEDHIPRNHPLRAIDRVLTLASCADTWRTTTAIRAAPPLIPS